MPKDGQPEENLLEVNNIEVIYNHVILVLKGVSLSVPKGGITALLGGNGAGKTTTLKAISGVLASERGEVTKGSIKYRGGAIQHQAPAEIVSGGATHRRGADQAGDRAHASEIRAAPWCIRAFPSCRSAR